MATHPELKAELRETVGKKVGRLRHQGILPATVYGHNTKPTSIQLNAHDFGGVIRHAGRTQLIDLVIGTERPRPVFIKNTQIDPKRNNIVHVEFFQPNLRQRMTSNIPVHVTGESQAVRDGGILLQVLDHVDIESLPDDVPAEGLIVDISPITEVNGALHISDLTPPPGAMFVTPADEVVVKVDPPAAEEVVEEIAEGTEPMPHELGGEEPQADAVPEA